MKLMPVAGGIQEAEYMQPLIEKYAAMNAESNTLNIFISN